MCVCVFVVEWKGEGGCRSIPIFYYLLSLGSVMQLLVLMHFTGSKGLCVVIYNLGSFREPTSYDELLAILQRQNSIKVVANDEDWDTIP